MKLLTETFNIKNGTMRKKDGGIAKIAYIDPSNSESTYPYKDKIKSFGASWIGTLKTWGWFLGSNPEYVYNNKIKPCLEFLTGVEKNDNGEKRNVINIIDALIKEINGIPSDTNDVSIISSGEMKTRLEGFKADLIKCVTSEEFKEKLEPIIKFKRARGHQFSFTNCILIMLQDPKATMVKTKTNWAAVNREVLPNAKAIWLFVPNNYTHRNKNEKDILTKEYLKFLGVKSINDLSIKQKEDLKIYLNSKNDGSNVTFSLQPRFFDFRFTRQIEGKEDIVGSNDTSNIEWFENGDETDDTIKYIEAIQTVIKNSGVKLNFVDDLNGARGVSKSGTIDVLKDTKKNAGLFNTMVHEFSHELLHQRYLNSHNEELKGYFIGTSQGRSVVEQQAELSAWIVLKNYGYDLKTSINYVGLWGMDISNAVTVFDTVSGVASKIITSMDRVLNGMNESKRRNIKESFMPDGYQLAKILGLGKVYKKSYEMNDTKEYEDDVVENIIKEEINRYINESFSSKKIQKLYNEHGGIDFNEKEIPTSKSFKIYIKQVLSDITDDMIGEVYQSVDDYVNSTGNDLDYLRNTNSSFWIPFKDGSIVMIKKPESREGSMLYRKLFNNQNGEIWNRQFNNEHNTDPYYYNKNYSAIGSRGDDYRRIMNGAKNNNYRIQDYDKDPEQSIYKHGSNLDRFKDYAGFDKSKRHGKTDEYQKYLDKEFKRR